MNPILSIIIPAFNASPYISKCLDSIYASGGLERRHYKLIETIVVDDCSKDDTSSIALEYANVHHITNLSVVRHEVNRQQGAARNTGLKKSQGSYIWFVDVDDIIMPDFLRKLHDPTFLAGIDVFQFNAIAEDMCGNRIKEDFLSEPIFCMTGKDYLEYEASIKYENRIRATWTKWYRREFLIQNSLFFREGVYWEDVVHTLKCIYLSNKFTYSPEIGYLYIQTPNSDMRGAQNGRKYADTIRFCIESFKFLLQQNASSKISAFQKIYYERVLTKYKKNLHVLTENEYEVFESIVSKFDLKIIESFCGNDAHNWILSSEGRMSIWKKNQ